MYIVHHVSGASNQGDWLSCRQIGTRKQQSGIGLVEDLHRIRPECLISVVVDTIMIPDILLGREFLTKN